MPLDSEVRRGRGVVEALYVADELNAWIVRIGRSGEVAIVAGGPNANRHPGNGGSATKAELQHPSYLVVDASGNLLFTDFLDNRIRKVDQSGVITIIAGMGSAGFGGDGGPATAATLNSPTGLALDTDGNLNVSDANNNRVRRIESQTESTDANLTNAPDGTPTHSKFSNVP